MGVEQVYVTVINCDGHDDDPVGVPFENSWGEVYFEDRETEATEEARKAGWSIGDGAYPAAWCPDCVKKREREAAGVAEVPEEIPGQLDIFAAVSR